MASVTQRIREVEQPYGGYLPIKCFEKLQLNDYRTLNPEENIHSSLIGTSVDYLTRYMLGYSPENSFEISLMGAANIKKEQLAWQLLSEISGLDDLSIINACKLSGFDVCYRNSPSRYKPIENIVPDASTIENIRILVERCLDFFQAHGPVIGTNITFHGGYSHVVTTGDADYLTSDTLWDLKVSSGNPTSKHTLQILMYYILGKNSVYNELHNISKLGFFNPRKNIAYVCPVSAIPQEVINEVAETVIGYGIHPQDNQTSVCANSNVKETLSVIDVCQLLQTNKSTIYKAIRSGDLKAYKKGGTYCIPQQALKVYLDLLIKRRKQQQIAQITTLILFCFFLVLFFCFLPK